MRNPSRATANSDSHPENDVLLRYVEDDLRARERQAVASHLRGCWTCRAQTEEIRGGIRAFMDFRETVLLPSIPIDPRTAAVRDRVLRAARQNSASTRKQPFWKPSLLAIARIASESRFRPAWIAGALSLVVCYVFFFSAAMEGRLMAGELLEHVERSVSIHRERERGKVIRQTIRFRRGASTVERDVVRGLATAPAALARETPDWVKTLSGPLTWDDPLDADSFIRWRDMRGSRTENVTTAPDSFTLTVVNGDHSPGGIQRVSLVVRKADWHIVAKRVEWLDEPSVEATEIGYEVRDWTSAQHPPAAKVSVRNDIRHAPQVPAPDPGVAPVPAVDLELAEIRVRSVLFHLGFGLGSEEVAPSVHRTENAITVQGVVSSDERRDRLRNALESIPSVIDQVTETFVLPPAMKETGSVEAPPRVDARAPQMRHALIQRLGDEKSATQFSNDILADSGKIFALAFQYRELARRYTPSSVDAFPENVRGELNALVVDMERGLHTSLKKESGSLNTVMGELIVQQISAGVPWQDRAERLFRLAVAHDKLMALLFAVTAGDSPKPESLESNLAALRHVCGEMAWLVSGSQPVQ